MAACVKRLIQKAPQPYNFYWRDGGCSYIAADLRWFSSDLVAILNHRSIWYNTETINPQLTLKRIISSRAKPEINVFLILWNID